MEKQGRDSVLHSLYLRVKEYKHVFLSLDDLKALGIQASQVETSQDGDIHFNPCFFQPYPERVLQKYPLDNPNGITDLNCPDLDYFLRKVEREYPDQKYPIIKAKSLYKKYLSSWPEDQWELRALETETHVECQISSLRKGIAGLFFTGDLAEFQSCKKHYERKHGDPGDFESGFPYEICWTVRSRADLCDTISPRPHSIVCTTAAVPASDAHQCLAIHEVRAIVYLMLPRASHGRFKDAHIHPLLLISYTGRKHGRIIQASYDGGELTIQYSQLWSFRNEATAPVELFVRYYLSKA
ncbi:hypothetical protein N7499_000425, partial [Penicillium canescens]